jgi:hypothetical protein
MHRSVALPLLEVAHQAGYGIRWRDEKGIRRRRAGFSSPSKARAWFRDVERPRMLTDPTAEPLTLAEFADRYLRRYEADRAPLTVKTLRWRLVRALDEFGDVKLTELRTGELAVWEATLPPREPGAADPREGRARAGGGRPARDGDADPVRRRADRWRLGATCAPRSCSRSNAATSTRRAAF